MSLSGIRGTHVAGAIGAVIIIVLLAFGAPWSAESRAGRAAEIGAVAVNCEPGQQALVRQVPIRGADPQVTVQCVTTSAAAAQQVAYLDAYGRPLPANMVSAPGYMPAVYTPEPRALAPVAQSSAPVRRTGTAARSTSSARSWKKTALVIGGSAGAGAGIGGLIGGKKGALIGAAIGGGGASLFEAVKR